jgi:hypothetical protein
MKRDFSVKGSSSNKTINRLLHSAKQLSSSQRTLFGIKILRKCEFAKQLSEILSRFESDSKHISVNAAQFTNDEGGI